MLDSDLKISFNDEGSMKDSLKWLEIYKNNLQNFNLEKAQ